MGTLTLVILAVVAADALVVLAIVAIRGARRRIADVRAATGAVDAVDGDPFAVVEAEDDLEAIRGIGSALAEFLRARGVRTYRQIALWTPEDVEAISRELPGFRDLIARDDWIGSARRLLLSGLEENQSGPGPEADVVPLRRRAPARREPAGVS